MTKDWVLEAAKEIDQLVNDSLKADRIMLYGYEKLAAIIRQAYDNRQDGGRETAEELAEQIADQSFHLLEGKMSRSNRIESIKKIALDLLRLHLHPPTASPTNLRNGEQL